MKNSIDDNLYFIKKRRKNISKLYLDVGNTDPEGGFSFETFDIFFSLEPMKKSIKVLKPLMDDLKKQAKINPEKMIEADFNNPLILHFSRILQVILHEMFHVYQNINSDILYCYSYSSIDLIEEKVIIVNAMANSNLKYKKGQEIIQEDILNKLHIKESIREDIYYTSNLLNETSGYIDFLSDNLSIFDLLEGAAFNFQLVMTRDIKCESFPPLKKHSIYNKAYDRFLKESNIDIENETQLGVSRIIFLLISTFSILCEDIDSKKTISMFIHLSKKSYKFYNKLLSIDLMGEEKFRKSWGENLMGEEKFRKRWGGLFRDSKNKPNYKNIDGFHSERDKKNLDKVVSKIKKKDLQVVYIEMCNIIDDIIDEIHSVDYYFLEKPIIKDKKFEAINNFMNSEFPTFNTNYFIPLLLCDFLSMVKFSTLFDEIKKVEYKYGNTKDYSVELHNEIINIIENIEILLDEDEESLVQCCDEHGSVNDIKTIINCNNNYSFNNRFNLIFNKNISDIIEV